MSRGSKAGTSCIITGTRIGTKGVISGTSVGRSGTKMGITTGKSGISTGTNSVITGIRNGSNIGSRGVMMSIKIPVVDVKILVRGSASAPSNGVMSETISDIMSKPPLLPPPIKKRCVGKKRSD